MDKTATPIPQKFLDGSAAQDEATLPMTKQGFKTPGPTTRLRGVEENTAKRDGIWKDVPEPQDVTDLEYSVQDAPAYRVREDN